MTAQLLQSEIQPTQVKRQARQVTPRRYCQHVPWHQYVQLLEHIIGTGKQSRRLQLIKLTNQLKSQLENLLKGRKGQTKDIRELTTLRRQSLVKLGIGFRQTLTVEVTVPSNAEQTLLGQQLGISHGREIQTQLRLLGQFPPEELGRFPQLDQRQLSKAKTSSGIPLLSRSKHNEVHLLRHLCFVVDLGPIAGCDIAESRNPMVGPALVCTTT